MDDRCALLGHHTNEPGKLKTSFDGVVVVLLGWIQLKLIPTAPTVCEL